MWRRSPRLRGFDYSSSGVYFVTTCTRERACVLGHLEGEVVMLSPVGRAAETCLLDTPRHHPDVSLDAYVVMPNHVHAVLRIDGPPLGLVVATFKAAVTRVTGVKGMWQRGYHDHVVRDEDDLARIREYIASNPIRWALDPENPARRP
jgi:REP element-mobilizing transposase RayT